MNTILWALIAIVVVATITEATRRSPFWLALLLLFGAPLAIIIYVIPAMASFSFFTIIKLMSVMAGSLYVLIFRFTRAQSWKGMREIGFAILAINVAEAGVTGLFQGNAAAAIGAAVLIATQAAPSNIGIDVESRNKNLFYDLGWAWILVYTIWNFQFVLSHTHNGVTGLYSAFAIAHLCVPLLVCWGKAGSWLEARAFALTFLMCLRVVAPTEPWLHTTPDWSTPTSRTVFAVLTIIAGGALLITQLTTPGQNSLVRRLRWGARGE